MNLKDLSRELGLSPTTVSRALNGYGDVSEATRARVSAAALRHGYRPDARAIRLATGRAMTVGHVLATEPGQAALDPAASEFIAGASQVYALRGYDMLLSAVPLAEQAEACRHLRRRGAVDGVVLHAPRARDPRIDLLAEIGLPFVVHGRATGAEAPFPWVDLNAHRAALRATNHLLDLGHRRIALIGGAEALDAARRWREGYAEALAGRGLSPDPALLRAEAGSEGYGYRATRLLLAQPHPPTAFVVTTMIAATGLRRALEDEGRRIGRDISVVVHDEDLSFLRNGETAPLFTAIRAPVRQAGWLAAEMLIDRIAHPDRTPETRLIEADLTLGRSTGPAPAADAPAGAAQAARTPA